MPAPLRSTAGSAMVSAAGAPLLPSPGNVAAAAGEPAVPSGWVQMLYDDFAGVELDREKWRIVFGASRSSNNTLEWNPANVIVNNSLTLRASRNGADWFGGGIQQGKSVGDASIYHPGYIDFQVTLKARFPAGRGVGAYIAMWPADDSWPPEFDIVETPDPAKNRLMVTWHYPGNSTGVPANYSVDLTRDHLFTVRRRGGAWSYWIDGVEQAVPTAWAQNPDNRPLVLSLANFVAEAGADWYGGAPDSSTPNPWDAVISYVRVHAPASAPTPTPTPPTPTPTPPTPTPPTPTPTAMGPLVVPDTNGLWFARPDGQQIALVGSHYWYTVQDHNANDPPIGFDWATFLSWQKSLGANCTRLWRIETFLRQDDTAPVVPMPYARTGPGTASDGKPKFNLTQWNAAYWTRLRSRVADLQAQGMYALVMFHDAWGTLHYQLPRNPASWQNHPFRAQNNVNGIDGYPGDVLDNYTVLKMSDPAIVALQEAFWRKMVDELNEFDNIIWETCNEPDTTQSEIDFLNHIVSYVRTYEAGKPKQHPIAFTAFGPWTAGGNNGVLEASDADAIGPITDIENPASNTSDRPWIVDGDHIFGSGGSMEWVWRTFLRGSSVLVMDNLQDLDITGHHGVIYADDKVAGQQEARRGYKAVMACIALIGGHVTGMAPGSESSTGFCLRQPGVRYITAKLGAAGSFTLNLSGATSATTFNVRYLNLDAPENGFASGGTVQGGATRTLNAPYTNTAAVVAVTLSPTPTPTPTPPTPTPTPPTPTPTPTPPTPTPTALGPLTVRESEPHWFVRPDGKAVLLSGNHNWEVFQDSNANDPPTPFSWAAYLTWFKANGGNCIRLWRTEVSRRGDFWTNPMPYTRPGPGTAADGKPRFDLNTFNQAYFDRMAQRVADAQAQGLYVLVMLHNAWATIHWGASGVGAELDPESWYHHPFQGDNNINGVDGYPTETVDDQYILSNRNSTIVALQQEYWAKVIDTLNGYDNVIWETCNEPSDQAHERSFMSDLVDYVKSYEATKPKRHPIVYTSLMPWSARDITADLLATDADGIGPRTDPDDPEVVNNRPTIVDSDHVWGLGGDAAWVWRTFLRGHSVLGMDTLSDVGTISGLRGVTFTAGQIADQQSHRKGMVGIRAAVDLIGGFVNGMVPGAESSTGFCLRRVGFAYITLKEGAGSFTLDLGSEGSGTTFNVRHYDVDSPATFTNAAQVQGGGTRTLTAPYGNTATVVWAAGGTTPTPTPTPPTPTPTPPTPTPPTPTPPGNQAGRLDILVRGQSNAQYMMLAGGPDRLQEIIAHLTQIPTVNVVARVNDNLDDSTIFSGTYSFYTNTSQGRWLEGLSSQQPHQWANSDPMRETLRALSRYVSSDPAHAFIDYRLHWEYDMTIWEDPWASQYREGTWEITQRIRDALGKNAGKVLTAYAYCSYMGGGTNSLDIMNQAWAEDVADASLNVVMAAGNMLDGEIRTEYGDDYSHNNNASLTRQTTRAAIRLARACWEKGWCPSGVDLSWLPGLGPRIVGATRSGNSINLTVQHDKGTALVAGASGIQWSSFRCPQVGRATGGAITGANTIRVDFGGTIPAGAGITYCDNNWFNARQIIRDNWHSIRPAQSSGIPYINEAEFLLQRLAVPLTVS